MSERIVIDVDRDGWTKGLQLNIVKLDESDRGWGYRLHGPKYNGSSENLLRCELDERDAAEIRECLDAAFPLPQLPSRAEVLNEAIDAARAEYLTDCTGTPEDEAYNQGVSDAVAAIGALLEAALSGSTAGDEQPEKPSRYSAKPAQVDDYLRRGFTEEVVLNYQRTIGNRAVEEAARDIRMEAAAMELHKPMSAIVARSMADHIDPLKGGGHYPSVLLCGKHTGFGPCPGAPRCTPPAEAGEL